MLTRYPVYAIINKKITQKSIKRLNLCSGKWQMFVYKKDPIMPSMGVVRPFLNRFVISILKFDLIELFSANFQRRIISLTAIKC